MRACVDNKRAWVRMRVNNVRAYSRECVGANMRENMRINCVYATVMRKCKAYLITLNLSIMRGVFTLRFCAARWINKLRFCTVQG